MTADLKPFEPIQADLILSWLTSFQDTFWWCGRKTHPLSPEVFDAWHQDPDIQAFLLWQGDTPVAYGEIWLDTLQREAELGRILVAPEVRGQGIGSQLVTALLDNIDPTATLTVYARIAPPNKASQRCFEKMAFVRLQPEREAELNEWEAQPFVWLAWYPKA